MFQCRGATRAYRVREGFAGKKFTFQRVCQIDHDCTAWRTLRRTLAARSQGGLTISGISGISPRFVSQRLTQTSQFAHPLGHEEAEEAQGSPRRETAFSGSTPKPQAARLPSRPDGLEQRRCPLRLCSDRGHLGPSLSHRSRQLSRLSENVVQPGRCVATGLTATWEAAARQHMMP